MVCVSRADKVIVGRVHQIPDALYLACYVVYILFWRNACFFCLLLDLLAMLVCSGLEINVVALQSLITRDRISEHDLIRISDMRLAGCVSNRGRHVKFSLVTHFVCSFLIKQKIPSSGLYQPPEDGITPVVPLLFTQNLHSVPLRISQRISPAVTGGPVRTYRCP
jgi:hypothetical protein